MLWSVTNHHDKGFSLKASYFSGELFTAMAITTAEKDKAKFDIWELRGKRARLIDFLPHSVTIRLKREQDAVCEVVLGACTMRHLVLFITATAIGCATINRSDVAQSSDTAWCRWNAAFLLIACLIFAAIAEAGNDGPDLVENYLIQKIEEVGKDIAADYRLPWRRGNWTIVRDPNKVVSGLGQNWIETSRRYLSGIEVNPYYGQLGGIAGLGNGNLWIKIYSIQKIRLINAYMDHLLFIGSIPADHGRFKLPTSCDGYNRFVRFAIHEYLHASMEMRHGQFMSNVQDDFTNRVFNSWPTEFPQFANIKDLVNFLDSHIRCDPISAGIKGQFSEINQIPLPHNDFCVIIEKND